MCQCLTTARLYCCSTTGAQQHLQCSPDAPQAPVRALCGGCRICERLWRRQRWRCGGGKLSARRLCQQRRSLLDTHPMIMPQLPVLAMRVRSGTRNLNRDTSDVKRSGLAPKDIDVQRIVWLEDSNTLSDDRMARSRPTCVRWLAERHTPHELLPPLSRPRDGWSASSLPDESSSAEHTRARCGGGFRRRDCAAELSAWAPALFPGCSAALAGGSCRAAPGASDGAALHCDHTGVSSTG
jgi:hypothetical protein